MEEEIAIEPLSDEDGKAKDKDGKSRSTKYGMPNCIESPAAFVYCPTIGLL